jgi:hypothetical protein
MTRIKPLATYRALNILRPQERRNLLPQPLILLRPLDPRSAKPQCPDSVLANLSCLARRVVTQGCATNGGVAWERLCIIAGRGVFGERGPVMGIQGSLFSGGGDW